MIRSPSRRHLAIQAVLLLSCLAAAPGAHAAGSVTLGYGDVARFTDLTPYRGADDAWLAAFRRHVEQQAAARLADGQQLTITVTDLRRAGRTEPWRGPRWNDVRVVRDIYPPRIELSFTLRAADGSVLREGDRQLTDLDFLGRFGSRYGSDEQRYERRLVDDWIDSEFGAAR